MQPKKLVAVILAILIVGISSPAFIPRGHADDTRETLTYTGYMARNIYDPYFSTTLDGVRAGSTISFTLVFQADSVTTFVRNMSLGIKFDWSNTYQNSSMANPGSTYTVFANQLVYLTLNATIPQLTGQYSGLNLATHRWQIQLWDGPANTAWTQGCGFDWDSFSPHTACAQFNSNTFAIYSTTQASAVLARQQANTEGQILRTSLTGLNTLPPGSSNAVALLAAASAQMTAGDNAYGTGDFTDGNTDYQNALNDVNQAQSSLGTVGGGTDTANLSSIYISAVAVLLGGIGAFLVGFAGFKYLRSRAKAFTGSSYSPSSAPKP